MKKYLLLALSVVVFGLVTGCECVTDECLCEIGDKTAC